MENPKITLQQITINQCKDVIEQIKIASQAGYCGIDLDYSDIKEYLRKGNDINKLKDTLNKYNLVVSHLASFSGWQYKGGLPIICKPFEERKSKSKDDTFKEANEFLKICSELQCQYVLTVSAIEESGRIEDGVNDLIRVCKLAGEYNRSVAFEFVGFGKQINNLSIAWDIINRTGCQNVAILLDTFHFHVGGSKIHDLEKISLEQIALVHINDAKDKPRNVLKDTDRVFPGEGIIPLEDILTILKNKGYKGYFSVEIFNEDYWKEDPLKVAIEAREKMEKILLRI